MTDKVKVSKWFDEWIKNNKKDKSKGVLIAFISPCAYHDKYFEYRMNNHQFTEKQYLEIKENFEDYVRAILDDDYEVEEEKTPLGWKMTKNETITRIQNSINQAYKYGMSEEYYVGFFDEVEKWRERDSENGVNERYIYFTKDVDYIVIETDEKEPRVISSVVGDLEGCHKFKLRYAFKDKGDVQNDD